MAAQKALPRLPAWGLNVAEVQASTTGYSNFQLPLAHEKGSKSTCMKARLTFRFAFVPSLALAIVLFSLSWGWCAAHAGASLIAFPKHKRPDSRLRSRPLPLVQATKSDSKPIVKSAACANTSMTARWSCAYDASQDIPDRRSTRRLTLG